MLKLAANLKLPIDLVTQTLAILAKRRVGKSYLMRRLVEQLAKAGQQVVLIDPKGDQWGIRSAADGKGPGLPFVILGGERGDVPLEVGAGAVVAKMLVEERVSAVLDLSLFRKREVAEFMGGPMPPRGGVEGFLEVLYRLKAQEKYRTPVMLVMDEADAIAPQNPQQGEERMLGAAEDIVRRGGQRGLGCIVVTQRSAVLNKNVLTQAEILVALRTIAPQDLKAMNAWIDVHGTAEQRKTLMESLPSLPVGEAWVWSPGWPTTAGIFQRVEVMPIETFDSGATPKPGEKRREPKSVADVDLEALKRQMADTIERAKADDPRELRKQVADLQRQVKATANAKSQLPTPKVAEPTKRDVARAGKIAELQLQLAQHRRALEEAVKILIKVRALNFSTRGGEALEEAITAAVKQIAGTIEKRVVTLADRVSGIQKSAAEAETAIAQLLTEPLDIAVTIQKQPTTVVAITSSRSASLRSAPSDTPARKTSNGDGGQVKPMERAFLTALAQHPSGLAKGKVLAYTEYRSSGSTSDAFARIVREGWAESSGPNAVRITEAGLTVLGPFDPLPTGPELRQRVLDGDKLPPMEKAFLGALCAAYPNDVAKGELLATTGYKSSGSTSDAFAHLVAIDYARKSGANRLRAADVFFEEA